MPQDLCDRSATEHLRLLESGALTATELIVGCVEQLDRIRPVSAASTARLIDAAGHADRRRAAGEAGPLDGLPVVFAADLPRRAEIVASARHAGIVVIDAAPGDDGVRLLLARATSAAFIRDLTSSTCVDGIPALHCTGGPGLVARGVDDLALFLPIVGSLPRRAGGLDIGAHSDSIADIELRDAVADVAALLSLHGNTVRDLDAGKSPPLFGWRRPTGRRIPPPDITVSSVGESPQWINPMVSLVAGSTRRGRPLVVRFTGRPGLERDLLDLARLVQIDVAP
ncbi:MAG: hypothetical protein M3443_06420 [Actinomycetota bacterium]|nr:hypothetical protein [Actinomycetota bacterium]